jgi:hypothetical protein
MMNVSQDMVKVPMNMIEVAHDISVTQNMVNEVLMDMVIVCVDMIHFLKEMVNVSMSVWTRQMSH